jgi:hypothetical protein
MDFHTSPFIPGVGEKFDAKEFADTLKKAKVNSINLFAKCHHGMYYYPTKIGTMHPALNFDLLGAQMKACREADIRACIYTTVAWNEDWADRHPEWQQVSPEGILGVKKPFSSDNYGWRSLCLNNRGLVDYMKTELKEMYDLNKPDRYWIDIVLLSRCICKTCLAEMQSLGLDPQNHENLIRHDRMVEIRFMKEIYEYLQNIDSSLGIYFNGLPCEVDDASDETFSARQKRKYNSFVDIESLPSDIWGYAHFPMMVNYLNKYEQELAMMNGKFHKAWGDFGSLRNIEALEYECFRALANGAKVCVGDQLHPSGLIDKTVYERIGAVFASVEEKEKYCISSKKVSQIGVFTPNRTLHTWDYNSNATGEGVYRMMSELHHLFDFIDFEDDINKYELVILPDDIRITSNTAQKLDEYISKGGKLLFTAKSGLMKDKDKFALKNTGVSYCSEAEYTPRYINISSDIFNELPMMDYVMYEQGVKVTALPGAETLAYINNPYFNRTYDKFSSHRQTPPAGVTDEPCIVKNGGVIYIANPLFRDYAVNGNKIYKDIIKTCIDLLLDKPLVKSDLPTTVEVTLRKQGARHIVHILNYIIQKKCRSIDIIEEKLPLYNQKIEVRVNAKLGKVYLAPQMKELKFIYDGGYMRTVIPEINGHQIIVLQ